MNRIILAYCHINADVAQSIDYALRRIGIPFEHLTDQLMQAPGAFAEQLCTAEEPVLLLITDNLLKSEACMTGLLPAFQSLKASGRTVVSVLAEGKTSSDGGATWQPAPTHIDRMVNALQYMNYWQNAWLELSTRHQEANSGEKETLEVALDRTRANANQMGEFVSALRETGYTELEQFAARDYQLFFEKFGLGEWHIQYRQMLEREQKPSPVSPPPPAPTLVEPPVLSGIIAPVQKEATETAIDHAPSDHDFQNMDQLLHEIPIEEIPEADFLNSPEEAVDKSAEIEQMIRDAWFWLERGHNERGLSLLELAHEQNPENTLLKEEYEKAKSLYGQVAPEESGNHEQTDHPAEESTPQHSSEEAKSLDLMGDMAAEKGDYLFAKYCWDRVADMEPAYPGIFRKLGIITSEYLRDYRETAVHYLQRALEQDPKDAEVYLCLAKNSLQNGDAGAAEEQYRLAVSLRPVLQTPDNDRQFITVSPEETPPPEAAPEPLPVEIIPEPAPQPTVPQREALTILVTGATSGIGRATAELFAKNGYRLIITGRRVERLSEFKAHLEAAYHSDVLMLPFDVRDQPTVEHVLGNLPEGWQNIDILINNAGLAKGLAPIQDGNLDHWETMIDTNIKGLLYVTKVVAQGMVRRRRGHIINLCSSAGKEVYVNGNVYCAMKFAVDALTRAIRLDLHTHNIRVSQVSPGHVEETEFAINRFDGDANRAKIYEDFEPLKAGDVAEVIYFMATRPAHVNIQDVIMFATQQASATVVDRSGRAG